VSEHKSSEFGTAMSGLIAVVVLIAVVYALTAGRFAAMGTGAESPEAVAARLAPVGKVNLAGAASPAPVAAPAGAAPAVADEGPGVAIYQKACFACHATGVANAPKLGDKAAWEPRAAQGIDTLLQTAIDGKGAMPPRGTCAACSDDDLRAAIQYMLSKAGLAPESAQATGGAAEQAAPEAVPAVAVEGVSGMQGTSGMEGMGGMSGNEGMSGMEGMSGAPAPLPVAPAMEGMAGMSGHYSTAPDGSVFLFPKDMGGMSGMGDTPVEGAAPAAAGPAATPAAQ
jgi:cytochrome c5